MRAWKWTKKLLVATHNQGKLLEYSKLLQDLPLTLTYLDEIGVLEEVAETGKTFTANAVLKAQYYASLTGLWTWADDSGLESGCPAGGPRGVHSARYAGPGATDQGQKTRSCCRSCSCTPDHGRARFQCVVAITRPPTETETCTGTLEGLITSAPRGVKRLRLRSCFLHAGSGGEPWRSCQPRSKTESAIEGGHHCKPKPC